jgi:hypothetical protein
MYPNRLCIESSSFRDALDAALAAVTGPDVRVTNP